MKKVVILLALTMTSISLRGATVLGSNEDNAQIRNVSVWDNKAGKNILKNKKFWDTPDFEYLLKHGECPPNKKCNFDGIVLSNVQIKPGSNFKNVSLKGADLRGMIASNTMANSKTVAPVDFTGANFDGALMNGCVMNAVICDKATFKKTTLISAYAPNSQFKGADFTDANLYKMRFFDQVNPDEITFKASDLQEAIFNNTIIKFTMFAYANMANAKGIGVSMSAHGVATLVYPTALYQDNGLNTAVFCATVLPVIGNSLVRNVVVSLTDSYVGNSWCNCSRFPNYKFQVTTGNRAFQKTLTGGPFAFSGVTPKHATNMGCA